MKKLLILIVVTVLLLSACTRSSTSSYTFRGHKLGDSLEDVIEKEGIESYEKTYEGVDFIVNDFFGYEAEMTCRFEDDSEDDSLYMIKMRSVYAENEVQDEVFDEMVQNLTELYGEPDWTHIGDQALTASWQKEGLLALLEVTPYSIVFSIALSYKGTITFHFSY
jgi:hypothetical protein